MLVGSNLELHLFSNVFGSEMSHSSISLKETRMFPFFLNTNNTKLILKVAYFDLWVINIGMLYPFDTIISQHEFCFMPLSAD